VTEARDRRRWDYAVGALLAITPLAAHLFYHDFPLFSIDAAGLVVGALGVGLAFGWVIQKVPPAARSVLLGLATIGFLDLTFNLESVMSFWIAIGAGFVVPWPLRQHYTQIMALSLGAILLTLPFRTSLSIESWERPVAQPATPSRLIPVVHIVLDEHSGLRGFPADIPEAARARETIQRFYQRHGFRLFVNAYSKYAWTASSLPALMGPSSPDSTARASARDEEHYTLTDNRLFHWASGRGYRLDVVQTSYLDFCHPRGLTVASCSTYPVNTVSSIGALPLSVPRRILLETAYFLSTESYLVQRAKNELSKRLLAGLTDRDAANTVWLSDRAVTGFAMRSLAEFHQQLGAIAPGSYRFGHFLMPHAPYEVDRNCKGLTEVNQRLSPAVPWSRRNTTASRRIRWALYAGQTECLYRQLDSMLVRLDSAAPPQGLLILIHGDHGSRIGRASPEPGNAGLLRDQDLLDAYSTLLAVRSPGIIEGIDSSAVDIQSTVPRLIAGAGAGSLAGRDSMPIVYLETFRMRSGRPVPFPAPVFLH
jgi:hypothetical protein